MLGRVAEPWDEPEGKRSRTLAGLTEVLPGQESGPGGSQPAAGACLRIRYFQLTARLTSEIPPNSRVFPSNPSIVSSWDSREFLLFTFNRTYAA
jgi:hypothetical protein